MSPMWRNGRWWLWDDRWLMRTLLECFWMRHKPCQGIASVDGWQFAANVSQHCTRLCTLCFLLERVGKLQAEVQKVLNWSGLALRTLELWQFVKSMRKTKTMKAKTTLTPSPTNWENLNLFSRVCVLLTDSSIEIKSAVTAKLQFQLFQTQLLHHTVSVLPHFSALYHVFFSFFYLFYAQFFL